HNEEKAKGSIKLLSGLRNAETLELFFWSKFKDNTTINWGDDLHEFNKKLQALPRASSSVTILFP
ncbi:hypothetical protein FRX31_006754, partial [Thalictrum thalictroides]